MANGRLFAMDLAAATATTLYQPSTQTATLTLSLVNRNTWAVLARVALAATATPTDAEWIEYDVYLPPSGVLERTALVVGPGQYLVARASAAGLSAVGFGFEE